MLELKPVTEFDYKFLFEMLKERTDDQVISFKMPSYHKHVKFVESKPYTAWYIILLNEKKIGNIYLTKNDELGYFITEKHLHMGYGTWAVEKIKELHPRKACYLNINPDNKQAIGFAEKQGGKLIQLTYKVNSL